MLTTAGAGQIEKGWGAAIPVLKGCFSLPGVHPDTTLKVRCYPSRRVLRAER